MKFSTIVRAALANVVDVSFAKAGKASNFISQRPPMETVNNDRVTVLLFGKKRLRIERRPRVLDAKLRYDYRWLVELFASRDGSRSACALSSDSRLMIAVYDGSTVGYDHVRDAVNLTCYETDDHGPELARVGALRVYAESASQCRTRLTETKALRDQQHQEWIAKQAQRAKDADADKAA